jgi:hypothetical protein
LDAIHRVDQMLAANLPALRALAGQLWRFQSLSSSEIDGIITWAAC